MPTNLTDVDEFTEPMSEVAAGDSANGTNEQSHMQKAANRTRYLYNRLKPITAMVSLGPAAKGTGVAFDLVLVASYYRNTSWTVGATSVQVPEAGLYEVRFAALLNLGGVTDGAPEVEVRVNGVALEQKATSDAGVEPRRTTGYFLIPIATPASEAIDFRPANGTGQTPATEANPGEFHQIIITRLGPLP